MKRLSAVVLVVVLGVIAFRLTRWKHVECPNHSVIRFGGDTTSNVPLAGSITLVPEFHDCQRLLVDSGTAYGPLAGIWVAQDLEQRGQLLAPTPNVITLSTGRDSLVTGPTVPAVPQPTEGALATPLIELLAWDGGYSPLGIEQGWNCLYFYRKSAGNLGARMVPIAKPEDCGPSRDTTTVPGTELSVTVLGVEGLSSEDFAPVGRWDWDSHDKVNYLGVKCGGLWCEVTPKPSYTPSKHYVGGGINNRKRRVFEVKGWYDEQRLGAKGMFGMRLTNVTGTIVPDPALGTRTLASFDSGWVPTGVVALDGDLPSYQDDYSFFKVLIAEPAQRHGLAQISMCHGSNCTFDSGARPECTWPSGEPDWWSRIETEGHAVKYRCVKRVDHSQEHREIPATARWWWEDMDEKSWMRCAEGCCTVE